MAWKENSKTAPFEKREGMRHPKSFQVCLPPALGSCASGRSCEVYNYLDAELNRIRNFLFIFLNPTENCVFPSLAYRKPLNLQSHLRSFVDLNVELGPGDLTELGLIEEVPYIISDDERRAF